MTDTKGFELRCMVAEDYDQVYKLWERIQGFAIRSIDDSQEYVERFIKRNPTTSVVALVDGKIVGSILCGHDGRQGKFYHVCVAPEHRKLGIGREMVRFCLAALNMEGISKAALVAFGNNEGGNAFWKRIGWTVRSDVVSYEFIMNKENITRYID